MPWDESSNGQKDPWNKPGGRQAPPDLGELFRKMSGGFGGKKGASFGSSHFAIVAAVLLAVWALSGIYIISEGQRGVELRFGAYKTTTLPGPHWHIPYPVEAVEKVDVDRIRSAQNKSHMLTQDENIVEVELAVQYRVKDAADFLFNVRLPDVAEDRPDQSRGTLFQVMESALREVVGKSEMDFILGEGRAEIAAEIKSVMAEILDEYRSGMEVVTVNLQQSQPPEAVQGAFADAIKAREDEIRFVNEAEAYSNGIIPQARGEAARMMQAAGAYREKLIDNAEGEAERFLQLYGEYRKAPSVTRKRLYLQAIESVFARTNKVMVDVEKGNNVFYLPLDRLMRDAARLDSMAMDGQNPASGNTDPGSSSDLLSRAKDRFDRMRGMQRGNTRERNNAN